MRAHVDISILTHDQAVGRVHGALEFSTLPRIGERVSFPLAIVEREGFSGQLTVEHVIHTPGPQSISMLLLSDVLASCRSQAELVGKSFESAYELSFDPYSE